MAADYLGREVEWVYDPMSGQIVARDLDAVS